jgi:uncharacterized protein
MKLLKILGKTLLFLFLLFNIITAFQAYRITYFYEQNEVEYKKFSDLSTFEKIKTIVLGAKLPKRTMTDYPKTGYETLKLKDSEGYNLEAWYVPVNGPKGTILLFHGHGGAKSQMICEAEYFNSLGYNTLSLDARSQGNSEGNVCTVGYKETEGVKLAYEFAKSKGEKNIILFGSSMGAAMIIKAVPEYKLEPQKLIINCPFATMNDAVKGYLRNMNLPTSPLAEMLMFWGSVERGVWTFNYKPVDYIKEIKTPTLFQWGAKDIRVHKNETQELFNNLGSADKTLFVYKNSGHEQYCKSENELWRQQMQSFLDKSY